MALRVWIAATTAALLWGGAVARAGKPADLPVKQVIICQPSASAEAAGCLLLGVGVNGDTGLGGALILGQGEDGVERLTVWPVEVGQADPHLEFTCPYLKQQDKSSEARQHLENS